MRTFKVYRCLGCDGIGKIDALMYASIRVECPYCNGLCWVQHDKFMKQIMEPNIGKTNLEIMEAYGTPKEIPLS